MEETEHDKTFEPVLPGESVAPDPSPDDTDTDSERRPVLGSLLLRDGLVTEEELDAALAQQRLSSTRRLGEILVARGTLSEAHVSRALAEQHELPFVELETHEIDPAARALLPVELARRHSALPVSYLADGSVLVVVADPTSAIHDDELRAELGVAVQYAVAVPAEIEAAIASPVEVEHVAAPQVEIASARFEPAPDEVDERPDRRRGAAEVHPRRCTGGAGGRSRRCKRCDSGPRNGRARARPWRIRDPLHASAAGIVVLCRIEGHLQELAILPHSERVTNDLARLVGVDIARSTGPRHARYVSVRRDPDIAASCRPPDGSWPTSNASSRRRGDGSSFLVRPRRGCAPSRSDSGRALGASRDARLLRNCRQ